MCKKIIPVYLGITHKLAMSYIQTTNNYSFKLAANKNASYKLLTEVVGTTSNLQEMIVQWLAVQ